MLDFFRYFFGAGPEDGPAEFVNFTLPHFLPDLITVGIVLLIYFFRDSIRNQKREIWWRYALAF